MAKIFLALGAHMFGQKEFVPLDPWALPAMSLLDASKQPVLRAAPDSNQFFLLALRNRHNTNPEAGFRLTDPHQIEPTLKGAEDAPDVLLKTELVAFHPSRALTEGESRDVTLRMDLGQDPASQSSLEPVFWSIAAGLDVYNLATSGGDKSPKSFRSDFSKAFNGSVVQVPGGLSQLRMELVAHKPAPWWKSVFRFASSGTAKSFASAVGFPSILPEAIKIIDEAFSKFFDDGEVLFSSNPVRYGLTEAAKADFTSGIDGVMLPALTEGLYVAVRGEDLERISTTAKFLGGYGMLVSADSDPLEVMRGGVDPFEDVTYAVIRFRLKSTKVAEEF